MESYTKNGLLLILIGLIINMIAIFIFGVYQFFEPVENIYDFSRFIVLGIIGGIGGVLSFVGGILFLIGKKEFGKKHQQFVIYAIICIVIGLVISIPISIASTFILRMFAENGGFSGFSSAVMITPSIISAITGGLAYIFALYELEDDTGRKILYFAFVISILISVIIAFSSLSAIEEIIDVADEITSPEDISMLSSSMLTLTQYSIFAAIISLLWAIAVYIPYKRINDGELVPKSVDIFEKSSSVPERMCPNCNKGIPTDANICPYCGKQFENYL